MLCRADAREAARPWTAIAAVLVVLAAFSLPARAGYLKPVLPMDPGDQFVWAYKPWQRIAPPT